MNLQRLWQGALIALAVIAVGAPDSSLAARRLPTRPPAGVETPELFMARVLRRLNDSAAESLELPKTAAWYDQGFLTLMQDNERLALARTEGPDLDYDPVCQCQANDGRYSVRRIVRRPGGEFADVAMRQAFPGDTQGARPNDYTIVLHKEPAGWRIWDVVSDGASIRAMLEHHNACLRVRSRDSALARCLAYTGHPGPAAE